MAVTNNAFDTDRRQQLAVLPWRTMGQLKSQSKKEGMIPLTSPPDPILSIQ